MATNKQNKGGAPSKYLPRFADQARKLCLLGCDDKGLASFFEVSVATINNWKVEHKRFLESLKGAKIIADGFVAEKLFKRAIGFYYDEVTYEKLSLSSLEDENIKVPGYKKKVVKKYVIPDVGAQTLWLKNRQKDLWREKQEIDFNNLPDSALDAIINKLQNSQK